MEGHQTLEEDDVGGSYHGDFLHAGVLDETVLWNRHCFAAVHQTVESFVGQVEVEGVGVVEVELGDVHLALVDVFVWATVPL